MKNASNHNVDITKLYDVSEYPTQILIDPNGVIIARSVAGDEVEKMVEEKLN